MLTDKPVSPGSPVIDEENQPENPVIEHDNSAIVEMYLNRVLNENEEEPGLTESSDLDAATVVAAKEDAATIIQPVAEPEAPYAPVLTLEPEPEPAPKAGMPLLSFGESFGALFGVLIASLPVLLVALGLRLWELNQQSAFMDEASNIITGRMLVEQGTIYANALQWAFGSPIYAVLVGTFDQQGGLLLARGLSIIAGLLTVLSTIFLTLGLFKAIPTSKEQAKADFVISSRPVMASLIAGLVVAILPTAIALSRFATYDATAAGLFTAGLALMVWAIREARLARLSGAKRTPGIMFLFFLAATVLFLAFLTKYVIALYFPLVCILVLALPSTRWKGLFSFVLPLSIACAAFYTVFNNDLNVLLQFASSYKDLRTEDWFKEYVVNRFDMLLLLLVGYWGLRQAMRNQRTESAFWLVGGAAAIIIFQLTTRADYDYWKHSIYLIIMLAPLVGWLWADWTWWDEPTPVHSPRIRAWWGNQKSKYGSKNAGLRFIERTIGGNDVTERPGSYSMIATLATILIVIGALWSTGAARPLVSHYPSVVPGLAEIQKQSREAVGNTPGSILVDDSGLLYYFYNDKLPLEKVTTPFYINYQNYQGLADPEAYALAVRNQQYSLIILDGGATKRGATISQTIRPLLEKGDIYQKTYSQELDARYLDGPQTLEIYRLMTPDEQKQAKNQPKPAPKPQTQATPAATVTPQNFGGPSATATAVAAKAAPTAAAPAATATAAASNKSAAATTSQPQSTPGAAPSVSPAATAKAATSGALYPAKAAYDFANGDEGWGLLPPVGELQPGAAVSATDAYKLENHPSLKFTPQIATKAYTVGVNKEGKVKKLSLFVYIPEDKAGGEVRVGMYYFDKKWNWNDDGFQTKVVPGQWTELKFEFAEPVDIKQFGMKVVGFSGAVYINGVSVTAAE